MEGPLVWPGQHAGFLGPKHDPWHIKQDPNKPDFRVGSLRLDDGLERLHERRRLLEQMNQQRRPGASLAEGPTLSDQHEKAFTILASGKVGQAFELEREPVTVRDRYGRHSYGQSLLLARRLVEAGRLHRPSQHGACAKLGPSQQHFPDTEGPHVATSGPRRVGAAGTI